MNKEDNEIGMKHHHQKITRTNITVVEEAALTITRDADSRKTTGTTRETQEANVYVMETYTYHVNWHIANHFVKFFIQASSETWLNIQRKMVHKCSFDFRLLDITFNIAIFKMVTEIWAQNKPIISRLSMPRQRKTGTSSRTNVAVKKTNLVRSHKETLPPIMILFPTVSHLHPHK